MPKIEELEKEGVALPFKNASVEAYTALTDGN